MAYDIARTDGHLDLVKTAESFGLSITQAKVNLLKSTVAKDCNDQELAQFLVKAGQTGLDPFANQLCMIRFNGRATPAVTIDGYRAIADRTGCYAPGREPSFEYDADNQLYSATAYVKKFAGGVWHEYAATAFWDEFAQHKPKSKGGGISDMWAKFPRLMLAKCAESLAIRRGFPAQTAGLYTVEEMGQAQAEIVMGDDVDVVIEHQPSAVNFATGEILEPVTTDSELAKAEHAYQRWAREADELGLVLRANADSGIFERKITADELKEVAKEVANHVSLYKRYVEMLAIAEGVGIAPNAIMGTEEARTSLDYQELRDSAADLAEKIIDTIAGKLPQESHPAEGARLMDWVGAFNAQREALPF